MNHMNKLVAFFYTLISILILLYNLIGLYDIAPLLFGDKIILDQNIASTFALLGFVFAGINMFWGKYKGLAFSLALTVLIWAISIVVYSNTFLIEMLKQLSVPFIFALILLLVYRDSIFAGSIIKEVSLAAVLWVSLRVLTFENIYNILLSILIFGITYYLLEMVYPLSKEASLNEL